MSTEKNNYMKNDNFRKCLDYTLQSLIFFSIIFLQTFQFSFFYQISLYTIFTIIYVFYCYNSLNSPEWESLNKILHKNNLIQILNILFSKKITFTFERISYHLTNQKTKEITSSKKKNFNYSSCRDVSGLFSIDKNAKNNLIELEINFEVFFDNEKTKLDYFIAKEKFIKKYENFDENFKFRESIYFGNKENYLINPRKKLPILVNKWVYLFFTFIVPIIEIYKIYMKSFFAKKNFCVKKVISTNKHLNNPINSEVYKEFNPRMIIGKKKFDVMHFFSLGSQNINTDKFNKFDKFDNDNENENFIIKQNEIIEDYEEKLKEYMTKDIKIFSLMNKKENLNREEIDKLFDKFNSSSENENELINEYTEKVIKIKI